MGEIKTIKVHGKAVSRISREFNFCRYGERVRTDNRIIKNTININLVGAVKERETDVDVFKIQDVFS